jgi:hypothetical protein
MDRAEKHASRSIANAANARRFAQRDLSIFSFIRRMWRLSMFKYYKPGETMYFDYRVRPPPWLAPPPPWLPPKLELPRDEKLLVWPP